jgi:fibronectin type 3 domain-containing protein
LSGPNVRFNYISVFQKGKIFHSWQALRIFCLFSFAVLSLLGGSGTMRGLHAQKGSDNPHSVTISWMASTSHVAGYNVYRSFPPGVPVKLTIKPVSGNQYMDKTVEAGQTYSYSVTSVDFKGIEGKPSGDITVTVPESAAPPAKQ